MKRITFYEMSQTRVAVSPNTVPAAAALAQNTTKRANVASGSSASPPARNRPVNAGPVSHGVF